MAKTKTVNKSTETTGSVKVNGKVKNKTEKASKKTTKKAKVKLHYSVNVQNIVPHAVYVGTIVSETDKEIRFTSNKSHSKKLLNHVFLKSDLLYWYGKVGEENGAELCVRSPIGPSILYDKDIVEVSVDENGTVVATTSEGVTYNINSPGITLVAESDKE